MRENISKRPNHSQRVTVNSNIENNLVNFPSLFNNNTTNITIPETQQNWRSNNNSNNCSALYQNNNNTNQNDLFSEQEFMDLTMELITKLRVCKNKQEQFGVITQLAFKFVYKSV